ncbi:MAG: TetR-like C-terminal domain-containing protein [Lactimicrobium massiliense]
MHYHTKEQLMHTYHAMVTENGSANISVIQLCTKCGIRRQTFYRCYDDIPDLIVKYCWLQIDQGAEHIQKDAPWQKLLLSALEYCQMDSSFLLAVLQSHAKERMVQFGGMKMHQILAECIEALAAQTHVSPMQKQFLCHYHRHALTGMILNWFHSGMKEDPDALLDMITDIVKDSLHNAINNFAIRNDLYGMPDPVF